MRTALAAEGVPLAALLPMHPLLARFRINEIALHPQVPPYKPIAELIDQLNR